MPTLLRPMAGILITIFFGSVLLILIPTHIDSPNYLPPFAPGSDVWPKVIAASGMLMGLILTASSLGVFFSQRAVFRDPVSAFRRHNLALKRSVLLCVFFVSFALFIPVAGFLLASILLLSVLLLSTRMERSLAINLAIGILFPCALYFIFSKLTNTSFPAGSLSALLGFS